MKNYNEMAQSVLSRISEYETVKKRKKKIFIRTAVPACCLCAAVIAGAAIYGAGAKGTASGSAKQFAGKSGKHYPKYR